MDVSLQESVTPSICTLLNVVSGLCRHRVEQEHVSMLKSPVIRYRSYWDHRLWLGDPKLLQDIFQAERDGLVEKPEFPPFHKV